MCSEHDIRPSFRAALALPLPTWATVQSWLDRMSKHGILLVFENSEEMLQDDDTTCEVPRLPKILYCWQVASLNYRAYVAQKSDERIEPLSLSSDKLVIHEI